MQGCEEKERVLLLWERALTLFYENDTELFVAGAQERTIAGKIAMYMDRVYPKFFQMSGLVIDIEYNRSGENRKPNNLSIKERSWTAPDIVLHKRLTDDYNIFCCEMKKNSDSGKYDARKVRSLIRHRHYKYGIATVYKGNIIKNLIMDCQSYTKYRPNETTGGIFVSWRRKEELPTGA